MRLSLSFLFVFGSLSLCHAQGVVTGSESSALDIQESGAVQKSSAPLLSEWEASYDKLDAAVVSQLAVADAPKAPSSGGNPGGGISFSPEITPEPSTIGLLLAGSAALFRFGRRNRSS